MEGELVRTATVASSDELTRQTSNPPPVQRQDSMGSTGFCNKLCVGASQLEESLLSEDGTDDTLTREASAPPPIGDVSPKTITLLFNPINLDVRISQEALTPLCKMDSVKFFGCDIHHTGGPNGTNKTPWTTDSDGNIAPTKQVIRWILTTMPEVIINLDDIVIILRQTPYRKGPNGEQLYFAPYCPFLKEMFDVSKHQELFSALFQDNPNGITFSFGMNLPDGISMLPMHLHGKDSDAKESEAYVSKNPKPSTSSEDHVISVKELAKKWFCNQVNEGEFRPRSFPFNDSNEVGDPANGVDGNPLVIEWMSEAIPIHTVSSPVELSIGSKTFYCGMPMERLS